MAVLFVLAVGVGESAGPDYGDTSGEPAVHHLLESFGADGEELGAVVEDAVLYAVRPHAAADLSFLFRSEEHTSELQSRQYLVSRLLLEKKKSQHRQYPV